MKPRRDRLLEKEKRMLRIFKSREIKCKQRGTA